MIEKNTQKLLCWCLYLALHLGCEAIKTQDLAGFLFVPTLTEKKKRFSEFQKKKKFGSNETVKSRTGKFTAKGSINSHCLQNI